jgi:hypothetical protein
MTEWNFEESFSPDWIAHSTTTTTIITAANKKVEWSIIKISFQVFFFFPNTQNGVNLRRRRKRSPGDIV